MSNFINRLKTLSIKLCIGVQLCSIASGSQAETAPPAPTPATPWTQPEHVRMLAASQTGHRVVAVGDHGVVLLSEDGAHFRQAKSVAIASTLTGVTFVDAKRGWAVGHWGAILATSDGGETWVLQRSDLSVDQPLFSVYFRTSLDGIAVGLWSLMLQTHDGGETWTNVALPAPPGATKADRNLYSIFSDGKAIYVTAEKGLVLRSADGGKHWNYIETGFTGSLWSGAADGNRICVGGLRGKLLCSDDAGGSWNAPAALPTVASISSIVFRGEALTVGTVDGTVFEVINGSAHSVKYAGEGAVTAIVPSNSGFVLFGTSGVSFTPAKLP